METTVKDICAVLDQEFRVSELRDIAESLNIPTTKNAVQLEREIIHIMSKMKLQLYQVQQEREEAIRQKFGSQIAENILQYDRQNRIRVIPRLKLMVGQQPFKSLTLAEQRTIAKKHGINYLKTKSELCEELSDYFTLTTKSTRKTLFE